MVHPKTLEDTNVDLSPATETQELHQRPGTRKRKSEEIDKPAKKSVDKKRHKPAPQIQQQQQQQAQPQQATDGSCTDDDDNEDARSESSSTCTTVTASKKKKSSSAMSSAFNRLQEIEDKAPLCVLGETESNMFPRKIRFMNHAINVMYDSRVHMWLKADDFAKALGYKNYKSAVDRYVHPSFVRSFPEVLDMSRTRYGDAFRLYSVNSKTLFINEAGVLQLLLRHMVSDESVTKEETGQKAPNAEEVQQETAAAAFRGGKHNTKPKLSADWINYQIQPSLLLFSEAAKNGITAKEERRLQSQNQGLNQ